jgi:hypothetical protein
MGKTKIITTFALFGFFIGTAAYFFVNWLLSNNLIKITTVSFLDIFISPWFISGIAGAVLSTLIVLVFARKNR